MPIQRRWQRIILLIVLAYEGPGALARGRAARGAAGRPPGDARDRGAPLHALAQPA